MFCKTCYTLLGHLIIFRVYVCYWADKIIKYTFNYVGSFAMHTYTYMFLLQCYHIEKYKTLVQYMTIWDEVDENSISGKFNLQGIVHNLRK